MIMTTTKSEPRPYLNPYLAGTLLGVVLFLAFFTTGGGLGASGALSHIQAGVVKWFAPGHVDRVAYLAEMAGGQRNTWNNSGVYMLIGTLLGGLASGLFHRRAYLEIRKGPRISNRTRLVLAFAGGLVMAYGARMARGCTSGQALSGGAVLSAGSWAFMFAVFGGGYAVAWFLRKLWI
jgi:uncharacterized protein